jgi:hypothetical protein
VLRHRNPELSVSLCLSGEVLSAFLVATGAVLFLSFSIFACTETQVRSRRGRFIPDPLPRPGRIVVYDFDTTPTEVVLDPSIPEEIARGNTSIAEERKRVALAAADVLAGTLVGAILALGLPAERGYAAPVPRQGTLIIDGQLVRIDEGSRMKRTTVGFGAGESELRTQVQVYHVLDRGRRLIAEFETVTEESEQARFGAAALVDTADAENPGGDPAPAYESSDPSGVVAADAERTAKRAAEILEELFMRQGWIR